MEENDAVLRQQAPNSAGHTAEQNSRMSKTDVRSGLEWQRRLLPFMMGVMTVMAALFFVFSALHIYQVTNFIKEADVSAIHDQLQIEIDKASTGATPTTQDIVAHSLLLLEADALDRRYHQAGGLLMSRIWSQQLSFVTGMVLAFVGAAFILGKLSEDLTQISGGSGEWKVAITSASPGIILSFFGTVIIVCSLFGDAKLDVSDGAAYVQLLQSHAAQGPSEADPLPPLSLDDMNKLAAPKKPSGDARKSPNP
jgi:hypothetical protein